MIAIEALIDIVIFALVLWAMSAVVIPVVRASRLFASHSKDADVLRDQLAALHQQEEAESLREEVDATQAALDARKATHVHIP